MNLPNKLATLRMILIIPFVIILGIALSTNNSTLSIFMRIFACIIFVGASITDYYDGQIARKYNLITNFGKFMDPLADKLLVCSALICLIQLKRIDAIIVTVIISREFIISGCRLVASDSGIVIAAGIWGKIKTVSQMLCICLLIMDIDTLSNFTNIMIYVMLALTIISLIDYIVKNYKVLSKGGM